MHQQAVVPIKICIGILKCNEKISFKKLFIGVILLGHSLNRKWSYCSLVFINKIFDLPHFWAILVGSYIDLKEPVGFFFSAKRKKKTNASMDSSRNHTSWREHSGGRMPAVWAGDVSIIRSRRRCCSLFSHHGADAGDSHLTLKYQMCSIFAAHRNIYGLLVFKKKTDIGQDKKPEVYYIFMW